MRTKKLFQFTTLFALAGALTACLETPLDAPDVSYGVETTIQDPCELYPVGDSRCCGVFLTGDAADWMTCVEGPGYDGDLDGVDDDCERIIAEAFAPELRVSQTDNARRYEPYWAVTLSPDYSHLRVLYLFSYNDDAGAPWMTDPLVPDWAKSAHRGDSEWILLSQSSLS